MIWFVLRRLAAIPLALLLVNFFAYAYAHLVRVRREARNPFFAPDPAAPSVLTLYRSYAGGFPRLDFGTMPYAAGRDTIASYVADAAIASMGLLGLAFLLSLLLGLFLGVSSVRAEPPRVAFWLTSVSTLGLAMPSYFAGSLLIAGLLAYAIWGPGTGVPLPIGGYGWDAHLVLPVLVLLVRPTVQIATVTGATLAGELGKQYVVAARGIGHPWRRIFRRYAFRNVLPSIVVTAAGSLRLLVGELIIVERLFSWPGLGQLVSQVLIPSRLMGLDAPAESLQFLDPRILAAALTLFALLFLVADFVAQVLVRRVDPRLRAA